MKPLYKVELVEKDNQHFYAVNNNPTLLPGVTGIINCIAKDALVPWAAKESVGYVFKILARINGYKPTPRFMARLESRAKKQPRFCKETAARTGSHAHSVFDSIIKLNKNVSGETPFLPSFGYWLKTEQLEIVAGDTKVASLIYGYGGSLDVLLRDKNGYFVIGDFKTGKDIYDTHAYQVAAYAQAFMETYGLSYRPKGVVFKFYRDKEKYKRWPVRDIDDSFLGFKAAQDLSRCLAMVQFGDKETIKPKKAKKEKSPDDATRITEAAA